MRFQTPFRATICASSASSEPPGTVWIGIPFLDQERIKGQLAAIGYQPQQIEQMTRSELQATAPERAAAAMGQPEALLTKFEKKPAITNQIDAIVAKGAERMAQATPDMRGLRPTEVDWLTTNQLQQLHSLSYSYPAQAKSA